MKLLIKKVSVICVALITVFMACIASAETRIALVIGNGEYSFSPLANPPEDARIITDALDDTGFDVIQLKNANQKKMKQAVREFSERLKAADKPVALFIMQVTEFNLKGEII